MSDANQETHFAREVESLLHRTQGELRALQTWLDALVRGDERDVMLREMDRHRRLERALRMVLAGLAESDNELTARVQEMRQAMDALTNSPDIAVIRQFMRRTAESSDPGDAPLH